ncbi:MarR family winged helix-turn-helix transcriptional regulator [Cellulomonas alba]|uniref:MarR family transcriptional regulator n=1 Tax=Cellulomonas alba TaxID=3053467 RepID=A0ABT7SBD7_9CELL|nr:MarR family transcriptional regulator [Cellulomonas alba]MDM7853493.1 MarR family transcriptional regulator [Cellulomonas alba]
MTTRAIPDGHFWYANEPDVRDLLQAVRRFRRVDEEMRRRISAGMDMNLTDLRALQYVIAAEESGETVQQHDLARYLGISTASTTKLLDRLTASGHLVRAPHPRDGRSVVVTSTDHARSEIRERLGRMHARMAEIARDVPVEARAAVREFLDALSDQIAEEGHVAPLSPRPHG